MPPIDGVQFDEEKMDLGALPPRVLPKTVSDRLNLIEWLMAHGIKSSEDAQKVLVVVVILNIFIILYLLFEYIL